MKKKIILGFACLAVLFVAVFFAWTGEEAPGKPETSGVANVPVGELVDGVEVQQNLAVTEPLCTISVRFATYGRSNHGAVDVQIQGADSGKLYAHRQLQAEDFKNNSDVDFELSELAVPSQDTQLLITITADSIPGEALTVWSSDEDVIADSTLWVNGEEMPGDLAITAWTPNDDLPRLHVFKVAVICAMMVLSLASVWFLFTKKDIAWERLFAILVFCFGLLYAILLTPFSGPDEDYHYNSVYRLSNYILLQTDALDMGRESDFYLENETYFHKNTSDGYLYLMDEIGESAENTSLVKITGRGRLSYFIQNIPPAIGIAVARILHLNFVWVFLLGRMGNLLFFTLCVYLAIRCIPRFKVLMGILSLFPMTLHQAASFSYDAFINGMAFLLIALLLQAIWGEGKLSVKNRLFILVTAVLLAPAKVVYTPIVLLALLIPKDRFGGNKKKYFQFGCLLAACVAMIFAVRLGALTDMATATAESGAEGSVHYSMSFVMEHPIQTIKIFLRSLDAEGEWWFQCMIGGFLSGLSLQISYWILKGFAWAAMLSAVNEPPNERMLAVRIFGIAISAIVVGLTMTALFFDHTDITSEVIQGVQGRYFIPVMPLMAMALSIRVPKLTDTVKEYFHLGLMLPVLGLQCITMVEILNFTLIH